MKALSLIFLLFILLANSSSAQVQPYGVIDTTDLKMTSCSFEKDANAEVLFDQAIVHYEFDMIVMIRHKRIKIFNDKGMNEANIQLLYSDDMYGNRIKDIEAETINLGGNKIEYASVDKKLIYNKSIDKFTKAIMFAFPNVKSGSVIEFKYKELIYNPFNYPYWFFQSFIPTRYSIIDAGFEKNYKLEGFARKFQQLAIDSVVKSTDGEEKEHVIAMSDIKSYKEEPYMDYPEEYRESVFFKVKHPTITWLQICENLLSSPDFGQQFDVELKNSDTIIAKATTFKTADEKIRYVFNTVKKNINWNKTDNWYTDDGVKSAWNKRVGNSTEINLILYDLLIKAGIKAYPALLSTHEHGKVNFLYPSITNFNKTMVYCPIDSVNNYVLDASSAYNTYNNTPFDLMGVDALLIDPSKKKFAIFQVKNKPIKISDLIEGSINSDGEFHGNAQTSNSANDRETDLREYNELGEKKYTDQVQSKYNGLKITSLKFENVDDDTLPLIQNFTFSYNLATSDGGYMYFTPNILNETKTNPFLSETRIADIDFRGMYNISINGRYTMPQGFKIEVLPKSMILKMPDNSITFKRLINDNQGVIEVHYLVFYKKSRYPQQQYADLRDFQKKMYDLLNEPVVLKKQ